MLKSVFQSYFDAISDHSEICVAVFSIETGKELAVTYDVTIDIGVYGELLIRITV